MLSTNACCDLTLLPNQAVPGLLETSPGVRSCMIEYDQRLLPLAQLLSILEQVEAELPSVRAQPQRHILSACSCDGLLLCAALGPTACTYVPSESGTGHCETPGRLGRL